jgi:hypothetical protein
VKRFALTALAVALAAPQLRAQVGYEPAKSPFRDLERTQEVSFFSGWYKAKLDPAQVAPRSGSIVGAHYQWRAGGPASITGTVSRVSSERRVLDPEKDCPTTAGPDCKLINTYRWPLYFFDAGIALSLTGARTFHHLAPDVRAGMGLVSDFHTSADVGDFAFGTRFAFNWGAGIRWVPGGRYQVRADFMNHLYSVGYPEAYYVPSPDKTQILAPRQKRSSWLNNPAFTIGVSYLFSR